MSLDDVPPTGLGAAMAGSRTRQQQLLLYRQWKQDSPAIATRYRQAPPPICIKYYRLRLQEQQLQSHLHHRRRRWDRVCLSAIIADETVRLASPLSLLPQPPTARTDVVKLSFFTVLAVNTSQARSNITKMNGRRLSMSGMIIAENTGRTFGEKRKPL